MLTAGLVVLAALTVVLSVFGVMTNTVLRLQQRMIMLDRDRAHWQSVAQQATLPEPKPSALSPEVKLTSGECFWLGSTMEAPDYQVKRSQLMWSSYGGPDVYPRFEQELKAFASTHDILYIKQICRSVDSIAFVAHTGAGKFFIGGVSPYSKQLFTYETGPSQYIAGFLSNNSAVNVEQVNEEGGNVVGEYLFALTNGRWVDLNSYIWPTPAKP